MKFLSECLVLSDTQWENCKLYIVDSHRPVHFNNIHFDQLPITDEYGNITFETGFKNAKVVVIEDSDETSDVPTFHESSLFQDDIDDGEDDDNGNKAHRRKVGDGDESSGEADEEEIAAEKREKIRKRVATFKIEQYLSRSYRSGSSALLMYSLAADLRKDTNESLWWGIIGLTDQYLNSYIGQEQYMSQMRAVVEDVSRLNPVDSKQSANIGRIHVVDDFKFYLLRYWTLYDSMYHSEYVACHLQLYNERKNDSNELRTVLAKMGIPRTEAEQKFFSMKSIFQEELRSRLQLWAEEFKIQEFEFPTFHKIRHVAHHISAADCVHIATALLNQPPPSGKWEEGFYKAYDAILVRISDDFGNGYSLDI